MKMEQKLRNFTLRMIQILVWFEILWAVVFLVGLVFQWSGLTDQLAIAFFGSGFCAVLVMAALAVLNVTANLNIISMAQVRRVAESENIESKPGSFIKTIAIAGVLIGIVVLSLWFAEWKLYQSKVSDIEAKIESVAGTSLVSEAISIIKNDGKISELDKVRDALAASMDMGARLSFIIPRKVKGVNVYYELTAWWHIDKDNDKISDLSLQEFIPEGTERKKWNKFISGEINFFTVPKGDNLRSFRRISKDNQQLIILIDTGRRSDYERSSF